jgi:hypothetical protein
LGSAARLQEPGSDPRLATAEQVKAWRDALAPERVDLTADEGEGDQDGTPTRPSPRSVRASPGEGDLSDLTDRTARVTVRSSTELPDLSSTNSDFTTFASGLLAQTAALFNASPAHRPPPHSPNMWRKITQALRASAGATHASSDISRLVGGPILGARDRTELALPLGPLPPPPGPLNAKHSKRAQGAVFNGTHSPVRSEPSSPPPGSPQRDGGHPAIAPGAVLHVRSRRVTTSFCAVGAKLRAVPLAKSPPNFRPKAEVGAASGDRPLLTLPSFLPSFRVCA